jgi:DtxR family Mn-dependent transcriptional regulator
MTEPLTALTVAGLIAVVLSVLFWPTRGLVWRWRHLHQLGERVMIEDALKHLFKYEYLKRTATVESLSGALGIGQNRAAELLGRLESLKLLQSDTGELRLTSEGKGGALRIIRVHRLWEHYLAEETGHTADSWHREAEDREHSISAAEADELDELMGFPVYDPHGDPIPTATGEIAPKGGQPVASLAEGQVATIVHIEDEPGDVFSRIVEAGLHLGMRVEIGRVTPETVELLADGQLRQLTPVDAANIFVAALPEEDEMEGPFETLAGLGVRERGQVVRISPACRGLERRRLMDLGIVPGTVIEVEMRSPTGDPTAYRIRGAAIALRKEQAEHVQIALNMVSVT